MQQRKEIYFFQAEFKKVGRVQFKNAEGGYEEGVKIKGYASTSDKDRGNDVVLPEAFRETIEKNYSKNPIILAQHKTDRPIGKATYMKVDEKGLYIEAVIFEEETARMVEKEVLRTFSIGYNPTEVEYRDADTDRVLDPTIEKDFWQIWTDDNVKRVIRKLELYEVSVVSIPMNQNALFSLAKSADSFFEDSKEKIRAEKYPSINPHDMKKKSENLLEKKEDEKVEEENNGADTTENTDTAESSTEEKPATESVEKEDTESSADAKPAEVVDGEKSGDDDVVEKDDDAEDAEDTDEDDAEDSEDEEEVEDEKESDEKGFDTRLLTAKNMKMALTEIKTLKQRVKELEALPAKRATVFEGKETKLPSKYGDKKTVEPKAQEKSGFKDAFMSAVN